MKTGFKFYISLAAVALATACTPPSPIGYNELDGVPVKAVTVIFGAPLLDKEWDAREGHLTWRHEVLERYRTPRRIFSEGRFRFDGFTSHEVLLTCDLTAAVSDGRIQSATLTGSPRACDAARADAEKVAALIDVLQEEKDNGASQ